MLMKLREETPTIAEVLAGLRAVAWNLIWFAVAVGLAAWSFLSFASP